MLQSGGKADVLMAVHVSCVYVYSGLMIAFACFRLRNNALDSAHDRSGVRRELPAGTPAPETRCPAALRPPATEACPACANFCDAPALNRNCSGHGACVGNACRCAAGWGGLVCAVETTDCASGKLDWRGDCCDSGVLDDAGECCASEGAAAPILTWAGQCCAAGVVDACGVCGGDGFALDIEGACCQVCTSEVPIPLQL